MIDSIELGFEAFTTPVKSTIRVSRTELIFDKTGRFGDREYMFVEAEGRFEGRFMSQRVDGVMALISSELLEGGVVLSHPDAGSTGPVERAVEDDKSIKKVSVHKWNGFGIDQGDEVAEWAREVFDRPTRLVRLSDIHPRYVEDNHHLGQVGFSDGYPLLVISRGSVNAISQFIQEQGGDPIEARNFGPNILLDSDEPFIEDYIKALSFFSEEGNLWELARRKASGRCRMPSRNPDSGNMREGISVLDALAQMGRSGIHSNPILRGKPAVERFFGQNFIVRPTKSRELDQKRTLASTSKMLAYLGRKNWIGIPEE